MTQAAMAPGPLVQPPQIDQDWREKIDRAKQVREATRAAREGKSPVFPMNWSLQQAKALSIQPSRPCTTPRTLSDTSVNP
jgi:hypothetical protein